MASELAGSAIMEAVRHRANHKPIIFCSLSLVAVGILMSVFGVIVLLLDHAELGPPVYDSQYERYAGSSLAHILGELQPPLMSTTERRAYTDHLSPDRQFTGPMFIGFGSLIIVGNLFMLAYASRAHYLSQPTSGRSTTQTSAKTRQPTENAKRFVHNKHNNCQQLHEITMI